MLIKDLILNFDYFAIKTEMLFMSKGRHPSWLGLFLTVIVFITTTGLLLEFSSNMIKKENPIITYSSQYSQVPKPIELNAKDFKFVIGLISKSNFEFITDPSLFKVSLNLVTKYYDGQKLKFKSNHLGVRYCEKEDFKYFLDDEGLYHSGNETSYLCGATYGEEYLKEFSENYFEPLGMADHTPINSESYIIEGDVSAKKSVFIDLKLLLCKNTSNMTKPCKSKEEMDKILDNSVFFYGISSNSFDARNYSSPYSPIIYSAFAILSTDHLQSTQFFLKKIKLTTDDGLLLQQEKSISFFQARDPILNSKSRTDDAFFEIFISPDRHEEFYYRNYDKIQDVLARTNSIIKIVLLVLYFFFKSFMTSRYHLSCYQNFYKLLNPDSNSISSNKVIDININKNKNQENPSIVKKNKNRLCLKLLDYLFYSKNALAKIELSRKCHDLAEIIQKSNLLMLLKNFKKEPPEKLIFINSAQIELNKIVGDETIENPIEEEDLNNKEIQSTGIQKGNNPAIVYLQES